MESFDKQPYEEWTIEMDFAPRMPSGTTIATMVVSARAENDGSNQSTEVLDATNATINDKKVTVGVKAGAHNQDYIISFRGVLSPGGKVEGDVRMRVREL